MHILVTGISGLLGNNLARHFKDVGQVFGWYHTHPVAIEGVASRPCDIGDRDQVARAIQGIRPEVIVHCASLTNVDQCETHREAAEAINVGGTRNIVQAAGDLPGCRIIYISSDSVYAGRRGAYTEADAVDPQNVYGWSKFRGEQEAAACDRHLVLRTNLFGWNMVPGKRSLAEWILHELHAGRTVNGFTDAIFSSIYTLELARIIEMAMERDVSGVFNCGSSNACSKYEFALTLGRWFGFDEGRIRAASIADAGFAANRGRNLSLDSRKLEAALEYRLPSIEYSIERFYRDCRAGWPEKIRRPGRLYPVKGEFLQYGRQSIDANDIAAVVNVIQSGRITQGPEIESFEADLARYCGARFAVAVNSGTSALHIACLAAGVGPGDDVITPPITFVASANCAAYCGGKPVFADIDPLTYNIEVREIEAKLGPRTKAVIPVHFAGQPCRMDEIRLAVEAAEKRFGHQIAVIEDGSHALGSIYKGARVGSCRHSDMTVMSFHPVKHVTTGEGGAVLTNDPDLAQRLRLFRSHGITSRPETLIFGPQAMADPQAPLEERYNPWYYEQQVLGFNYRITDFQCALGRSQLSRIETFRARRRAIVQAYREGFDNLAAVALPYEDPDCDSNFHLFVLQLDFDRIGRSRAGFMFALRKRNIQTQVHYIPVHTQPFYQQTFGTRWGDCPIAEAYYRRCLSIPLFPAMDDADVERVVRVITRLAQGRKYKTELRHHDDSHPG